MFSSLLYNEESIAHLLVSVKGDVPQLAGIFSNKSKGKRQPDREIRTHNHEKLWLTRKTITRSLLIFHLYSMRRVHEKKKSARGEEIIEDYYNCGATKHLTLWRNGNIINMAQRLPSIHFGRAKKNLWSQFSGSWGLNLYIFVIE